MMISGSSHIYGKKVEFLFSLLFQTLERMVANGEGLFDADFAKGAI